MNKIEADTSKYTNSADRVLAAAECIKAQRAGKKVQCATRGGSDWTETCWSFGDLHALDYRVKPEPVVTWREVYVIRANVQLSQLSGFGIQTEYESRAQALDALRCFWGACAVDKVVITYHDGKEVSREVREAEK